MTDLALGGIYSGAFSSAATLLALSVWLVGGASRYAAVLAGRTERQVERATAVGLFMGVAFTLPVLIG